MARRRLRRFPCRAGAAAAFGREDGSFTHCGIAADYKNGATLGLARTASGDLMLEVRFRDWALKVGERLPLTTSLSGSATEVAEALVVAPDKVVAKIAGDAAATDDLREARQVSVEAAGRTLVFDTSDIGPGVEAIDSCVAAHAG